MERSLFVRLIVVTLLALALLVPVSMIRELVAERQARRDHAVAEIAQGWGRRQILTDPYIAVPYERRTSRITREVVDGRSIERMTERNEQHVLRVPVDAVQWRLQAATSEKSRGIYSARLYSTKVEAHGRFTLEPRFGLADDSTIRAGTPRLVVGVSDPRGLRSVGPLQIDGASVELRPGGGDAAMPAGVQGSLGGIDASRRRSIEFSFAIELTGSEGLFVSPLARESVATIASDWPHPSFQGQFLPERSDIRDDGFEAHWRVSQHASQGSERLAACEPGKACAALAGADLGVSFIEPVGLYQLLERASKYGVLFVGMVFGAFWLFETLRQLRIHPIQYLLVGLALAMFFLLLTALSEHIPFAAAYAIASFSCIALIAGYLSRVLRSARAAGLFAAGLAALYALLYALLRAEDYSLLGGAAMIFVLLAAVMAGTRGVDWYALGRRPAAEAR